MPKRATYHHGNLERALVRAAVELVAAHGADGFSLRQAAAKVGVDPASVYRHFRDRGAVLAAVAQDGFVRLARVMERAIAGKRAPRRILRAMGAAYLEFAATRAAHFQVMFGPHGPGARPSSVRGVGRRGRTPFELLLDALAAWRCAEGLTLDLERTALVLWSGVHGLASLISDRAWRPDDGEAAHRRALGDLLDAMFDGLAAPRGAATGRRG